MVGRTKVTYQELFCLTRKEIKSLIEGHEIDIRDEWNLLRELTGIQISPWIKKGSGNNMKKVLPFPWDKEVKKTNPQSVSKVKKLAEIYRSGKIIPRNNGKSENRG